MWPARQIANLGYGCLAARHVVPLSDPAMAILNTVTTQEDRKRVFGSGNGGCSGWSKSKVADGRGGPTTVFVEEGE
jgi:hypothetical protein